MDTIVKPDLSWLPAEIRALVVAGDFGQFYEPVVITEEKVFHFAVVTGDDNPIHLDDAVARAHGLRGKIAHGDLVIASLPNLLEPLFCSFKREKIFPMYVGGGAFEFKRPVPVGESIKARVKIPMPVWDRRGAVFNYEYEICFARNEKLVACGTKNLLCPR